MTESLPAVFEDQGAAERLLPGIDDPRDLARLESAQLPALCEEIFCRGYLLSGLRGRGRTSFAIIASAVLFGILHLDPGRLLTTTCLGALLAVVVIRSGSILPAMLLHFLNNATAVALQPDYRAAHPEALPSQLLSPVARLIDDHAAELARPGVVIAGAVAAAVLVIIGVWLLRPRGDARR